MVSFKANGLLLALQKLNVSIIQGSHVSEALLSRKNGRIENENIQQICARIQAANKLSNWI